MSAPDLRPLAVDLDPAWAAMTFPSYRHLLSLEPQPRHPELGETRAVRPFGVTARRGGRPVGLLLAEAPPPDDGRSAPEGQILSVFVLPGERRRRLASALVAAAEVEARARGLGGLTAVYTTGKPGVAWMERVFARRGWSEPAAGSLVVRFAPADGLRAPVFGRAVARFREGLDIFPWSELAAADLEAIRRSNRARRWIEPALEPWRLDAALLDPSSVGARHRGQVVGWVLNHRVPPASVRFSVASMRPDLLRRGKMVALCLASVERIVADGSCRECTFITPFSYPRMIAFVRQEIAPIARSVEESRRVRCELPAAAPMVTCAWA